MGLARLWPTREQPQIAPGVWVYQMVKNSRGAIDFAEYLSIRRTTICLELEVARPGSRKQAAEIFDRHQVCTANIDLRKRTSRSSGEKPVKIYRFSRFRAPIMRGGPGFEIQKLH